MERAVVAVASNLKYHQKRYEEAASSAELTDDLGPFMRLVRSSAYVAPEPVDESGMAAIEAMAGMFDSATDALLAKSSESSRSEQVMELKRKLRMTRKQLRTIKESIGYKFLQRMVRILRPLGPVYSAVRRGAASFVDSNQDQ